MSAIIDTTPFYKRLAYNLVSLAILCVAFYLTQGILKPLFFAILLSVLLLPVTNFFRRIKFNRLFSILTTIIISSIVILTIIYFLSRQVFSFLDDFENIQKRLDALYYSLQHWVKSEFGITIIRQDEYIHSTGERIDASKIVGRTFVSLTEILSYLVLLPIYTFLILYYEDHIKKFLVAAFKNSDEDKVRDILRESRIVSHQYIVGLLIEIVIVFALNAAGFLILGIHYALFLALVAALLNLVPYIGMLVANIFCMIITFVFSENIYDVVWVGVILAVVQFIDNNFLMTLIVGSKVKINALMTLLGVLAGGAIWGISGMFLSIPALAVLKVIFDRVDSLKPYGLMLGDDVIRSPVKLARNKKNQNA
ncbi:MAG TPA: AI-2E family transporter [Cyclobacteriaceae bacterium]|nr:AI-2E family transporter [Cyclobacteriaceae bacterium]